MKPNPNEISPGKRPRNLMRRISSFGTMTAQVVLLGLGATIAHGQGENFADDEGAQVLTRGPIHEAFAEMVSYNPEPGVIVQKAPPGDINELPPEVRPDGENITWIPGYWGWDDERDDYLWISGTWRALPPGRQWTTGYWGEADQGHQWTSGYWGNSSVQETTYLPRPPITVEAGPNVAAPSNDYGWTPGSWMWQQERYAWRPGYWAQGRSDWDWIPAHYVWTPRGYVFVDGYWDYSFERRGVLYAPVHFQRDYYSRPGYSYSPVIAIGLSAIMEHLFLRPTHRHYYFGDYYDRRYRDNGYYSPYAYQSARRGYDPVYSYRRWTHREDRDWERNYEASYDYRRDNESARPPRTWAAQKKLKPENRESREQQLMMAAPFQEMAKRKDSPMRLQAVSDKERQQLTEVNRKVGKIRDERRAIEKDGSGKKENEIKPTIVKQAPSPIVGKSPKSFDRKQAPPESPRAPSVKPEKAKGSGEPTPEKTRPETKRQPEPRDPEKMKEQPDRPREEAPREKKEQPDRPREETPREKKEQPDRPREETPREKKEQPPAKREAEPESRKQQPEPERRMEKPQKESRPEKQPKAREPERDAQPAPRQPSKPAPRKPAEEEKPKGEEKESSGKSRDKERK